MFKCKEFGKAQELCDFVNENNIEVKKIRGDNYCFILFYFEEENGN